MTVGEPDTRRRDERLEAASRPGLISDLSRITAVSRIRGTRRIRQDTQGHVEAANQVQEDTGGAAGILKDTSLCRFGTVRPRVQIPGPPTIFVFKIGDFRVSMESAARSRITISYGATKPRRRKRRCRGAMSDRRTATVGQVASQAGRRTGQDREAPTPDLKMLPGSTTMDSLSSGPFSRTHPWGWTHPTVDQCPIMPRIIAGIPSRTNPLTSCACSRIALVIRASVEVSVTTTPLAVSVSSRR